MKTKRSSKKTRAILKAIAEGNSFEQILGRYSTLNYHDIFRAAAQAPASHWQHKGAQSHNDGMAGLRLGRERYTHGAANCFARVVGLIS